MIETILFLVGIIIIFVILLKIIKSVFILRIFFRLFTIALSLLIILLIVSAAAILMDANSFRSNFGTSDNLFVLAVNNTFLTAVELNNSDKMPFKSIDPSTISTMQDDYYHSRMDAIQSKYYKMFIFSNESIDAVSTINISNPDVILKSSDIKDILLSDNPRNVLASIIASQNDMSQQEALARIVMDDAGVKSYIFSYVVSYYFYPGHINYLLSGVRNSNIIVYKQTAMFTAVKLIPAFLAQDIIPSNTTSAVIGMAANLTRQN